jgi:predicted nucleic acid-binding protein
LKAKAVGLKSSWNYAAIMVTPYHRIFAARDPDDDKVLECATEAKAEDMVTGNIRGSSQTFRGVAVVLPRRFLDILTSRWQ